MLLINTAKLSIFDNCGSQSQIKVKSTSLHDSSLQKTTFSNRQVRQ